jgi:hypothetical protein
VSDKTRNGRGVDDHDVQVKTSNKAYRATVLQRGSSAETDRLGREQQRRATAYARARGQL